MVAFRQTRNAAAPYTPGLVPGRRPRRRDTYSPMTPTEPPPTPPPPPALTCVHCGSQHVRLATDAIYTVYLRCEECFNVWSMTKDEYVKMRKGEGKA